MTAGDRASGVGRDPERIRLEHRARRVAVVMSLLERRRDERLKRGAPVPPALSDAIGGFEAELRDLNARLRQLDDTSSA
jgi:hypothetical protein